MSITNGEQQPENSDNEQSNLVARFNLLEYLVSLGLPLGYGQNRSDHIHCSSHEDVPGGPVLTLEEAAITATATHEAFQSSVPPTDPKIPARLRPFKPPANFGAVSNGSIFRSAYPAPENYGFLKSLKLKTILTLVPEPIAPEYSRFMKEHGIQHFQVHIPANKDYVKIGACDMTRALEIVLDRSNHPLLIHCNKGKHRTGCVVGCFRRVQGDEFSHVFEEYHTYAGVKARILDEAFIELFEEHTVLWMARRYGWVKSVSEQPTGPPSPTPTFDSTTLPE